MYYTNPNRTQPGDGMNTTDESTYAHDCSGARILGTTYANQYLMDPSSPNMATVWKNYIASRTSGRPWDAMFEDDANSIVGVTATPCNYSASDWLAASQAEITAQSPTAIVYNGLQRTGQIALNQPSNVVGGMGEGCYADAVSSPKIWAPFWNTLENAELQMAQQNKLFMCLGRDTTSAASSIDGRLYTYASFLLTYTPASSILWEGYGTPSAFRVEPEIQLVALNPLVPSPGDVSGLLLSTGVYGREYANCYIAQVPVGPCATVVNPDHSVSHAYPYGTKYTHTLTISGSGIIDGGSISSAGPPPPQTLPPLGSTIVFQ
ncbi:MAG: hypothetical protein DLM53_08685 [Candidatus Eremiobacter antarcticus]|nr:MAG: hypothetical protein DLM53_08685 [Candidatus Eremiobacter sp. RRmetagenome_bin22]